MIAKKGWFTCHTLDMALMILYHFISITWLAVYVWNFLTIIPPKLIETPNFVQRIVLGVQISFPAFSENQNTRSALQWIVSGPRSAYLKESSSDCLQIWNINPLLNAFFECITCLQQENCCMSLLCMPIFIYFCFWISRKNIWNDFFQTS